MLTLTHVDYDIVVSGQLCAADKGLCAVLCGRWRDVRGQVIETYCVLHSRLRLST